ncbi:hypothetical protein L2E82_12949 [Cichorium intybus]|uniref:Uncharacterized protein n=1 Tax=Cichorium intybus TaxID=13427 RepID=A0ACB9GIR7_CICIN|nr:hypothetical protein L2E82_12949 [Cichorium intybus]
MKVEVRLLQLQDSSALHHYHSPSLYSSGKKKKQKIVPLENYPSKKRKNVNLAQVSPITLLIKTLAKRKRKPQLLIYILN